MKKIYVLLLFVLLIGAKSFATDVDEVKTFFNSFVNASNNYDTSYFNYYIQNPVIVRIVEKKNGTSESVTVAFSTYKKEGKIGAKLGRLRHYKNNYSIISVESEGKDYRLTASRKPSTSDYSLPAYFIIGKDSSGAWKIKKEVLHTKVQTFLKRKHAGS